MNSDIFGLVPRPFNVRITSEEEYPLMVDDDVRLTTDTVHLRLPVGAMGWQKREAYRLEVRQGRPTIWAFGPDGVRHARRILAQLRRVGPVPDMTIIDRPEFPWRGLSVDIVRHFFGPDDLVRVLDLMADLGFNRLHLHLSDDQGWRIEVPAFPELVEKSSGSCVGGGEGGYLTLEDMAYVSKEAAARGIVVISGLALGVDAIAHRAALDAHDTTLAVLPCGLPRIAPATNRGLAEDIIRGGGALLCEYDSDTEVAWKSNMLERNRLVAGIADAILITEASARSGTLNTAAHALEQGKTVFVAPGNITSPSSAGCNALLKQGATPVTCVEDILEVIAPQLLTAQTQFALGSNPTETEIINRLQAGVRDGDEIQRLTGIAAGDLSTSLTMLELAGTIKALGANQWTLR